MVFIRSSELGKQGSGTHSRDLHFYGQPLLSSRTKCRKYQQFSSRQLAIIRCHLGGFFVKISILSIDVKFENLFAESATFLNF